MRVTSRIGALLSRWATFWPVPARLLAALSTQPGVGGYLCLLVTAELVPVLLQGWRIYWRYRLGVTALRRVSPADVVELLCALSEDGYRPAAPGRSAPGVSAPDGVLTRTDPGDSG